MNGCGDRTFADTININDTGTAILHNSNRVPFAFTKSLIGVCHIGIRVLNLIIPVAIASLIDQSGVLIRAVTQSPSPAIAVQRVREVHVNVEGNGVVATKLSQHFASHLRAKIQITLIVTGRENTVAVFKSNE